MVCDNLWFVHQTSYRKLEESDRELIGLIHRSRAARHAATSFMAARALTPEQRIEEARARVKVLEQHGALTKKLQR